MEIVEGLLIFLAAIIVSSLIHSLFLPKVPLAFIQIVLGALLFLTPIPVSFDFDTEVFMVALIAPLLFVEGVQVSRVSLRRYIKPVMLMALGLVFTTVVGVGFFIHWVWPNLPMPAGFALAAILCPTDAVAVSAITKGKILPKGAMTILEGESLLNDAAGIISFKIAVTALITGTFSITHAVGEFLVAAIGGLIVGMIIGIALVRLRVTLSRRGVESNNMFIFIQLLTPFVTYLIAEVFHASGIIAAVVAGLVHGFERDRITHVSTQLQLSYTQTWNVLSYALNGFVFVILGYMVPEVVVNILKTEPQNLVFLLTTTGVIALAVYVFRFVWVYVLYPYFYLPVSPFERAMNEGGPQKPSEKPKRSMYALIMTLCGVHGTISLAIALTLPFVLGENESFIYRNDLLFISSGMVILSLVIAQVFLPLVTPAMKKAKLEGMSFKQTRVYILEQVVDYLRKNATPETSFKYGNVIKDYHDRIAFLKVLDDDDEDSKELERLQGIAFDTETKTLDDLAKEGRISQSDFDNYMRYAERTQVYRQASLLRRIWIRVKTSYLRRRVRIQTNASSSLDIKENLKEISKIMRIVHYNVVKRLSKEANSDNQLEISTIADSYLLRTDNLTPSNFFNTKNHESMSKIKLNALREQRHILNELVDEGEVSEKTALKVRKAINYDEMILVDRLT
ncbi:sodium:proton antiporter [Staphylococcus condimenti]|uniref:Sodium:proton antiporter n=1 Tax=Staphylococcus condimenti TaxID=70255 RepID=A0A143PCT6_9STAP|nr:MULTISPECIES: sodium:proton antiporter [Staphylococcus]AMY05574.1 sodium:proton antiporter [Staphylococcus condimenti]APR61781.1 sodium:proton antiporter [Staphylococcus condimenti]OFO99443.1 sodium:proton antiporter [Staphylococcus sp. HMSC065E08]PNZ62503.1 sodium:proton antiporter [Staphylococcus condimenti]QQS82624.1 sodium:proton antiporter [Staphylococcus condimenti]